MLKFCSAHIQLQTGHSDKKTLSQSVSPHPYSAPSNQSSFHQTHPQAIHIHNTQSVFIPSNTSTGNPHPQHATVFIPSNTSTGNPLPQHAISLHSIKHIHRQSTSTTRNQSSFHQTHPQAIHIHNTQQSSFHQTHPQAIHIHNKQQSSFHQTHPQAIHIHNSNQIT